MLSVAEKKDPIAAFWDWFTRNKSGLESFIDSASDDYTLYNELTREMKKCNDLLFPELTMDTDDKYVLIITPDGISEGVEPTQNLAAGAPVFANWKIMKFRQPKDSIRLAIEGIECDPSDIEIIPEIDRENDKVDIRVFIRNMNKDEKKYQHLCFLYLDHILGEYNTITKVGYIDFHHLDEDKHVRDSIDMRQLRELIEKELY